MTSVADGPSRRAGDGDAPSLQQLWRAGVVPKGGLVRSTRRFAVEAGLNQPSAAKVLACGLVEPDEVGLACLTSAASIPAQRPAFGAVRLARPVVLAHDWRPAFGWHQSWSPEDKRDAVRGDWMCDPFAILESGWLLGIVLHWVVGTYAVEGIDTHVHDEQAGRYRYRFRVRDTRPGDAVHDWLGCRVPGLGPGWVVSRQPAQDAP